MDIAVLGIVVIGGWYFLNNYKGSGGSGGGGSFLPTTTTTEVPVDLAGRPLTKQKTCPDGTTAASPEYNDPPEKAAARAAISAQYKTSCGKCTGGTTKDNVKKCHCAKSGKYTTFVCEKTDGSICMTNLTTTPNLRKAMKMDKCKANWWDGVNASATYRSSAAFAHNIARIRPVRELNTAPDEG